MKLLKSIAFGIGVVAAILLICAFSYSMVTAIGILWALILSFSFVAVFSGYLYYSKDN